MAKRCLRRRSCIICFAVVTTVCAAAFAFKVVPYWFDFSELRQTQAALGAFDAEWLAINPDYVGWLMIYGTDIDFPVMRGSDNEKYLTTTFDGKKNRFGAVFMDYRCVGEYVPHIIIYAHEVDDTKKNTFMFGGLYQFLDERYLAKHPIIMFMENDSMSVFDIFSARMSDIGDPAYNLDFSAPGAFSAFAEKNGAPPNAKRIITLSTCFGTDDDKRIIVQGALRGVVPVITEYEGGNWTINMRE